MEDSLSMIKIIRYLGSETKTGQEILIFTAQPQDMFSNSTLSWYSKMQATVTTSTT